MLGMLKLWLTSTLVVLAFAFPTKAELILFKRMADKEHYYPVDAQTYHSESNDKKTEIKKIFNEVLMIYQWPMVAIHFFEFSKETQDEYLEMLKQDHGVSRFIQNKLDKDFGKGTYKVHFIPTTFFELAGINGFMNSVINTQDQPTYGTGQWRSIFPDNDIRNGSFAFNKFGDRFAGDILKGMRAYQGNPNADLLAMKNACYPFNHHEATFEMYLYTTSYLVTHFKNILEGQPPSQAKSEENIQSTIEKFVNLFETTEASFYKNLENKDKELWGEGLYGKSPYNKKDIKFVSRADVDSLIKGTHLDYQAEEKNEFLLFRGTGGFQIGDSSESSIIDSPYRESAQDYAEAIKNWPKTLKKDYLAVTITNNPSGSENTFYPISLSFGNSLVAGTFWEASASGGARVLDYLRGGYGYALKFPIIQFFKDTAKPALGQKYLIAALHPLVALFAKGEYFHSRSKLGVFDTKKSLRGYGGINMPSNLEKEIIELDRKVHEGLIVAPDTDWRTLSSSIAHDIANSSVWLKEPRYGTNWLETQRKFAYFSSFEVAGFKDHFLKFQNVLAQIKTPPLLRPTTDREQKPVSRNLKFGNNLPAPVIPETQPDERDYQLNVFTKIISNPANNNTTPIIETPHSISFNDLRKRTKEHALVVPKGHYISFSHFVDFAKPEEIMDLMRSITATAKKLGIAETGYRIITNNSLNPGQQTHNDAEQEIPHFHIHLAGGECLGKPVAGSLKTGEMRGNIDMSISPHPFASDWTPEQFYQYANTHKIGERGLQVHTHEKYRFIAYRMGAGANTGVNQLIGFLVVNDKRLSAYASIHDFLEQATAEEITTLFKLINDTVRSLGIYKTGFRLIANSGNDAGQYPKSMMNIMVAGGNLLGVTVTNLYGNHKIWEGDNHIYDYVNLEEYPHGHCATNAHDTFMLLEKMKENIPEKFKKLAEEQSMDLSYFKGDILKKIKEISNPEAVIDLDLTGNELKKLPASIGRFKSLKRLILIHNELTLLPDEIKKLHNLEDLDISSNKFKVFPSGIESLENIKILDASNNSIESLPETIKNLKNLKGLYMSSNKLNTFPGCFDHLKNLTSLHIQYNRIEIFPESITKLTKLENLDISNNNIQTLPENIGDLSNLQTLKFSNNKLESLPGGIGDLAQLKDLNLSDNQIKEIPKSIGNLKKLTRLNLLGNQLKFLPKSVEELKNITHLNLNKNPDFAPEGVEDHLGRYDLMRLFGKNNVKF